MECGTSLTTTRWRSTYHGYTNPNPNPNPNPNHNHNHNPNPSPSPHPKLNPNPNLQAVGLAAELAGSAPGADRAAVPRAVAEGLVQAALRLGSTDNVTVLVVWLVWDG